MALPSHAKATVAADNLLHCSKEEKTNVQKRLSHLSDIAHIAADALIATPMPYEKFCEAITEQGEAISAMLIHDMAGISSANQSDKLEFMIHQRLIFDKICISDMLLNRLAEHRLFDFRRFSEVSPSGGSISYVRHKGADSVFNSLKAALGKLTVNYADDLREACSEVVTGQCAYAILPTAEADGSELSSILAMIRRHVLKICAKYSDDTHTYVVVSRSVQTIGDYGNTLLSVRLGDEESVILVSQAAHAHGYKVNSAVTYTLGESKYTEMIFEISEPSDSAGMLLLLLLFAPTAALCGIYHHIIL